MIKRLSLLLTTIASIFVLDPVALRAAATLDKAACSTADKASGNPALCDGNELVDSINQEISKLYQGNLLVVTIDGPGSSANVIKGSTTPVDTTLDDGDMRQIKPPVTNTSTVTYNDNSLGAKQVVSSSGAALSSGDLQSSSVYILRYYAANDEWRVLTSLGTGGSAPSTSAYVTIGSVSALASERALTAGSAIAITDGGADSTVTVALSDSELNCLVALTSAADKIAYYTGSGTCALADFSSYIRTLVDDASSSAARATLGVVIGTDVQAYDADLAALAGNSTTGFWAYTGAGTGAARTLSAPAAGLTITNPAGTAGNPTFALANDLAALEALSGTNSLYYRSGSDAWSAVTIGGLLSFSGGTLNVGDAELTALAGLTSAADALAYFNGAGTAATTTLTSFGRSLIDDAAATNARATLGVVIGTDVQAYDAELAALAGLTSAADTLGYFNGAGTAATTTLTSFGRSLIDDAAATNARTTLGVAIGSDVQAYDAQLADLAGITYAQGDVIYFNGTNLVNLGPGTSGQFLKTNGAAANPSWATISGGGDLLSTNNLSDVANASTARTNLGVAIGSNVQAYDSDLTTWAGLTPSANAQSLVTAANYAAMRALLDLEAGTDFYSIAAADSAFISPSEIDTSAEIRAIVGDEGGTGGLMFGLSPGMSDDLTCTGSQVVRRNAGDTAFECATVSGTGDMVAANNLSDVASAATAFANIKQAATTSATGVVELATTAEAEAGTDATRAITADGLLAAFSGKKTIWVPAGAMLAETTTGCASGTTETTTNQVMYKTLDCDASTKEGAQFNVAMPKSWNESTITFRADWTAASGSGDVVWAFSCLSTSNDDTLDAAFGTEVTVTDTLLAAGDDHQSTESGSVTASGTPAENDNLWCRVQRDAASGSDTLAVDAKLLGVRVLYTTNAMTDD